VVRWWCVSDEVVVCRIRVRVRVRVRVGVMAAVC
jgi:hypothetical protein